MNAQIFRLLDSDIYTILLLHLNIYIVLYFRYIEHDIKLTYTIYLQFDRQKK